MALVALTAACGGGDESSTDGEEATASTTSAPASGNESTEQDAEVGSTTSTTPPASDDRPPPPAAIPLGSFDRSAWAQWSPLVVAAAEPAVDLDESLVAYFSDVLGLVNDDPRRLSGKAARELRVSTRQLDPDIAGKLSIVGDNLSMGADLFALTLAHAEANAASSDENVAAYWAPRVGAAAAYVEFNLAGFAAAQQVVDAPADVQQCFIAELTRDGCSDADLGELAQQAEDAWDTYREADIDDADSDRANLQGFFFGETESGFSDFCELWGEAARQSGGSGDLPELWAQQIAPTFVAVDDTLLDGDFLGLSDCAREITDDEDPLIRIEDDAAAFGAYAEAVIAAMVEGGYDEEVYDLGYSNDDADLAELERVRVTAAVSTLAAAVEAASDLRDGLQHPESWSLFTSVASLGGLPAEQLDFGFRSDVLPWEDFEDVACPAFVAATEDLTAEQLEIIDFSYGGLSLGDLALPGGCDVGGDSADSSTDG